MKVMKSTKCGLTSGVLRVVRTTALLGLLPACLSMGGCSKDAAELLESETGAVPVSFSVEGIEQMVPVSRATLDVNTTVRVIAYKSSSSNPSTDNYVADQAYYWNGTVLVACTVDANGANPTAAADQSMVLTVGESYDFYAVSPALPLKDNKTMIASVPNGVDYAVSVTPSTTVNLGVTRLRELRRQCAQIQFNLISEYNIDINQVKIYGFADAPQSDVTVGSGLTSVSGGGSGLLSWSAADFSGTATSQNLKKPIIVQPMSEVNIGIFMRIAINGVMQTFSGELNSLNLESNHSYVMVAELTLSSSSQPEISLDITVANWEPSNSNNPSFEYNGHTYPYVLSGNTIVISDLSGGANIPTHPHWMTTPAHSESTWTANTSGLNTVTAKFEVASEDIGSGNIYWSNAAAACSIYQQSSDDVGSWRLPTIRELMVIYDLKSKLSAAPAFGGHWAATAVNSSNAWNVNASKGGALSYQKTGKGAVRCVRDI